MRTCILAAAHDLLSQKSATKPEDTPRRLDEIAACAGITTSQLRAYYTSVYAIENDLRHSHARGHRASHLSAGGC